MEESGGDASAKAGCACGTPGTTADPCPGCVRVMEAAAGAATAPPQGGPPSGIARRADGGAGARSDSGLPAVTRALFGREIPVSRPGDTAEREADRMAAGAERRRAPSTPAAATSSPGPAPAREGGPLSSGGAPLSPALRSHYEPRFGRDLGDVRVHTGPTAERYAGALRAQAFTYGSHIWMGGGRGVQASSLLAHEIAHISQQAGGGSWGIARQPAEAASPGDPDRTVSLGVLDQPFFDRAARIALGDVEWVVFRELLRGAAGGAASITPAQMQKITAKFSGMSPGQAYDFIIAFGKGVGQGFWSSLTGLVEAIVTLVKIPFEIEQFLVAKLPQLAIKYGPRIIQLATRAGSIVDELRAALRAFISNPGEAAKQLQDLLAGFQNLALAKVRAAGRGAVEQLVSFLGEDWPQLGNDVGKVVGMVLFEVVLAVATEGIGELVADIGRLAGRVGSRAFASAAEFFSSVRRLFTLVSESLGRLGRRIGGKLGELIDKLIEVWQRLLRELEALAAEPGLTPGGVSIPVPAPKGPTIVESRAVRPPAGGGGRRVPTRIEDLRPTGKSSATAGLEKRGSRLRSPGRRAARFGAAHSFDYTRTFFSAYPELEGKVIVHHAVEQQTLTRFPGVVTESQIHSLENLRGIPLEINAELHLSKIRKMWNQFYRTIPKPTVEQLLDQATKIDDEFGRLFLPPLR